jgi:tetratricopeptide (TPR) repeat protein
MLLGVTSLATPQVLLRLRNVPTRAAAAAFTFGGMLGIPALFAVTGCLLLAVGVEIAGALLLLVSVVAFFATAVTAWVLIFQAKNRLERAERALYAGDYGAATRDAQFVVRTVFRADYQLGALFTLALAAERLGAFAEAGSLFTRALDMIPAMAAQRPGRRARALIGAHAALALAAANDLHRADAMLARCWAVLGATGQPGAFEALLDDSYMGAVGINTILVELENRREPRPVAVLAAALCAHKRGGSHEALHILANEQASMVHGLAAHEKELAERIHAHSLQHTMSAGPHRSAGMLAPTTGPMAGWATLVLPERR